MSKFLEEFGKYNKEELKDDISVTKLLESLDALEKGEETPFLRMCTGTATEEEIEKELSEINNDDDNDEILEMISNSFKMGEDIAKKLEQEMMEQNEKLEQEMMEQNEKLEQEMMEQNEKLEQEMMEQNNDIKEIEDKVNSLDLTDKNINYRQILNQINDVEKSMEKLEEYLAGLKESLSMLDINLDENEDNKDDNNEDNKFNTNKICKNNYSVYL